MARVYEITFEVIDRAHPLYRVVSRVGNSGESPERFILYEGHTHGDAEAAMRKAVRSAINGQVDRIQSPY